MQEVNSYLRLAMMFGGNQARTSRTNIEKMCELILLDSYPKALSSSEIVEGILLKYSLNFAEGEILDAITSRRAEGRIVCVNPEIKRVGDRRYTLNEEVYNKLEGQERHSFTEVVIEKFIDSHDILDLSKEEFEDLLDRYFYYAFNNNANIIMGLLQPDYQENAFLSNENTSFSEAEKEVINQFINWDNSEKDKCVYEMVSCCFDYCMLTARKGADDFHGVFNGKQFFLDTNIIFRSIGINQDNRKRVIDSFLSKCKDVKIQIAISNFTVDEIERTIDHHVNHISSVLKGRTPLKPESIAVTIPDYINTDFYRSYCNWCSEPGNKPGDYESFRDYLKRKARIAINQYVSDTSASFDVLSQEKYLAYCENLASYKKARTWNVNDNAIKTDINNFMRVVGLNDKNPGSNLFNANTFLISADHHFCDWAKEIRPGAIPLVVLPSVWYAIILQYNGRAENSDYASFTRFLKFSLSSGEVPNERWGRILIDRVLALDENSEIKDKIIENVVHRLKSDMKDVDDEEEFNSLIEEEHKHITDIAVEEAEARLNVAHKKAAEQQREHFNEQLERVSNEFDAEIKKVKEEVIRTKQELENQKTKHEIELTDAKAVTKQEAIDEIISREVEAAARNKRTRGIILCFLGAVIPIVVTMLKLIYKIDIPFIDNHNVEVIVSVLITVVIEYLLTTVLFQGVYCGMDLEKLREIVRPKIEKKLK